MRFMLVGVERGMKGRVDVMQVVYECQVRCMCSAAVVLSRLSTSWRLHSRSLCVADVLIINLRVSTLASFSSPSS